MANRTTAHGLTAEARSKIDGKYSIEQEIQAREWIEAIVGEKLTPGATGADNLHEALKDGKMLCKLINILAPGSVKKINDTKMAFKLMENIGNFLTAIERYGVSKTDAFQTVDLYENQNMTQVVLTIHALGRAAQKNQYAGPVLGPKESVGEKREFTEEQLRAGQNVIGLQMGSNKGANQSGQNFGKGRMIID
ncbi:muscle-specific protein 20-like [Tubulanus polymorphus]|uniref:muscle-specific protein 20-like n=1 Tax=Tubulanus polymorphus TaxID=672921 RepID=UPI003DA69EFE